MILLLIVLMGVDALPAPVVTLLFLSGITAAGVCRAARPVGEARLAFTVNPALGVGRLVVLDLIALPYLIQSVTLVDTSLSEAWGDVMHPISYAVGVAGVLALWQPWGLPARWLPFPPVVMRRILAGFTLLCFCGALPLQVVSYGLRELTRDGVPVYRVLVPYAFPLCMMWFALQYQRPSPAAAIPVPAMAPRH